MNLRTAAVSLIALGLVACPAAETPSPTSKDPTAKNTGTRDARGDAMRKQSMSSLHAAGFRPATSLPTAGHRKDVQGKLRPTAEIARRLMALQVLVMAVTAKEDEVPSRLLRAYVDKNKLDAFMTEEERKILALSREAATEKYGPLIGWRMENMWPLAWALGFGNKPPVSGEMVNFEILGPVFQEFLPRLDADGDVFITGLQPRSLDEIAQLEDELYCAHNAVRSAQTGRKDVVPKDFDPVGNGGVIHERRHSLTWVLSPGVAWHKTDLST